MDADLAGRRGAMSDPNGQRGPVLVGLPKDAQGVELFADRDEALRIFAKFREISNSAETFDKFRATFDPTKPGAVAKFENTLESVDRLTIEELGLASSISDWSKFPGILKVVYYKWRFDPAVLKAVSQFIVFIHSFGPPLQLGSPMEDPRLLTMANEEACVLGGSLRALFREFQDRVDFLCVYLAEAHPAGRWNFGLELNTTTEHATAQDRQESARKLMTIDAKHHQTFTDDVTCLTQVRLVLDTMDNGFAKAFDAHPDRILVVEGGRVAFIGRNIEMQLDEPDVLMTDEARSWLRTRLG